jgi:hypothetical protein
MKHTYTEEEKEKTAQISKQIITDRIEQERKADALDVDTYFMNELIRRRDNHTEIICNLIKVFNKIYKKL